MASSSTTSINKISCFKYDVFLSFRGDDTRTNFVDHLYDALKRQNIETYKDDKNLQKGSKISKELIKAIEESRFHVVVFSKNYASSWWCLEELVKIMECQKRQTEQILYPIFYDVEPTEVRKQSGEFGKAFSKHENDEAAEKWREALVEAASFSGWDLGTTDDGHEVEFIKRVVKEISSKLPSISANENLVGMRTRINGVVSSLNAFPDEFCMIGIWGMGGSGKTTLARAVFDQICNEFEGVSFVENVREGSNSPSLGLKSLQQQILRDVLNTQDITVTGVLDGKTMMKRKMPGRRVLVVLDDVDHIDQLKALAGEPNWFKPGSKIIITTRDKQVLVAHKVNSIHDVNLLTDDEAIFLLSRCAFGTDIPIPGYKELSKKVVSYAASLPLTITILGSSLCDENELVWIDTLQRLEKIPLEETLQKLELSYMGLDTDCKEIFLDIACILKGWKKDDAIRALESCGFHAIHGLKVLEKRSLINISKHGCLGMHDHIEEMGRYIVRRSSLNEPGRHTRLWIEEEIKDILVNDLGSGATTCLKLIMRELNPEIVMKGLGKMVKLRLLHVNNYYRNWRVDEVSPYFPNSLQYLNWSDYPFRSLPKTFLASNLVCLEIRNSEMEQLWKGGERKVLHKLRFLHLIHSKLRSFDLGLAPNLEILNLEYCFDLVELHMPVGCPKLKSLNLNYSKLSNLDLRLVPNIETLNLKRCKELVELDIPCEFLQLKSLNMSSSKLRSLNLGLTPKIETLNIEECNDLVELDIPHECPQLKTLTLQGCDNLVELCMHDECCKLKTLSLGCPRLRTFDLGLTQNLEVLTLDGHYDFVEFLFSIRRPQLKYLKLIKSKLRTLELSLNLKMLILEDCDLVEFHIPDADVKLKSLDIKRCSKLKTLDLGRIPNLKFLCLEECIPDFGRIYALQHLTALTLEGNIPELPNDLDRLKCLEYLILKSTNIKQLPDSICMLKHLRCLTLSDCKLLEKLPEDLGRLECLETLILSKCLLLRDIPNSICRMKSLKQFILSECEWVEELPDELGRLEYLEYLNIQGTCIKNLPKSILSSKRLFIAGSKTKHSQVQVQVQEVQEVEEVVVPCCKENFEEGPKKPIQMRVQDMRNMKKFVDIAFRDKDYNGAVEYYSKMIFHGELGGEYSSFLLHPNIVIFPENYDPNNKKDDFIGLLFQGIEKPMLLAVTV